MFKLFNRVGPLNRLSLLVVIREKVSNGLLQILRTDKMIGLQKLALQDTKPDFELIQPGSVRRQPKHMKGELTLSHYRQFPQPALQLLWRVGGAIVENQVNRLHTTLE